MAHQSYINNFTTDEEIEGWVVGDESIEIHGFVDSIEGLKLVTTKTNPRTALYKITVNNGSRSRVRVLFWTNQAKKFSPLIHYRCFISITGAKSQPNTYVSPSDAVSPLQLVITSSTDVVISPNDTKYETDYSTGVVKLMDMKDLENVNAVVDVKGYLKQEFRQASSYGGSYAAGVLVDKKIRLPLRVIGFNVSDFAKFSKGCLLKVRGKAITPAEGPTQMRVDSFDDITPEKDAVPLTPDQLRLCGIVSPKRKCESDLSENENKRLAE